MKGISVLSGIGAGLLILAAGAPRCAAAEAAGGLYDRIISLYMNDKWGDLQQELASKTRELGGLTPVQKTDIAYIRQAVADGRPAWWNEAKAGQSFNFRPVVWGQPLFATFDPNGRGMNINFEQDRAVVTFSWKIDEMDNTDHAEHGFSKGELSHLGVWMNMGGAHAWVNIPLQMQANMDEQRKAQLSRYLDFRSNITGAYYSAPRSRRWGLWLCLAAHMEKYSKMPTVMARKAEAAMFIAEVLSKPAKYPSIKLPDSLSAENAEEKLSLFLKDKIEKQAWTFAEDKLIRDALRAFAAANDRTVVQTGTVRLPSGVLVSLDPVVDQANRLRRDAWTKAQYDKAIKERKP